jgi:prophage regulatory protein
VQLPSPTASQSMASETRPVVMLRMPTVRRRTALGRSTIYRLMGQGLFPLAVRLGPRAVGWRDIDIDQWLEQRPDASH